MQKHTEYFYPDDIIVFVENGKRVGRLGYNTGASEDRKYIEFVSDLDVIFSVEEEELLIQTYHKIWLKARERFREQKIAKWLEEVHPRVIAEKRSWEKYYREFRNDPACGISHWRRLLKMDGNK